MWEGVESFEEHVHQFSAPNRVPCLAGQHFEIADVLVDVWEVEGEVIQASLGNFLFRGICELGLELG